MLTEFIVMNYIKSFYHAQFGHKHFVNFKPAKQITLRTL